jgi:hypothetical protein
LRRDAGFIVIVEQYAGPVLTHPLGLIANSELDGLRRLPETGWAL